MQQFFFAAMYQLKQITVAIFNCASFHSLYCIMNRKGKSFQQTVSIGIRKCFAVSSYNTCSNVVFWIQERGRDLRRRLPLSHRLRVVRRLMTACSSSLHRAPGTRPCSVTASETLRTFKRRLKTHQMATSFP